MVVVVVVAVVAAAVVIVVVAVVVIVLFYYIFPFKVILKRKCPNVMGDNAGCPLAKQDLFVRKSACKGRKAIFTPIRKIQKSDH